MATPAFEELVEDFDFLDDWEDRYRHVIDQGKAMEPLADALRVPATKVDGCASQVWLHAQFEGLNDHLSAQRSNGLRAMIERIKETAAQVGKG